MLCIDKEIVMARAKYVEEGRIDRSREPFSVRAKKFWPLSEVGDGVKDAVLCFNIERL